MAVVTNIIDTVCSHAAEIGASRVVSLTLHVGEVRDIHEELLQRYFDHFSRGTAAEGIVVDMVVVPLRYRCDECGSVYGYDLKAERILCPEPLRSLQDGPLGCACGHAHPRGERPRCLIHPNAGITVVSGTELFIEDIGVI